MVHGQRALGLGSPCPRRRSSDSRMPAPLLMRCLRLSRQRTLAAGYAAYRPYSESD